MTNYTKNSERVDTRHAGGTIEMNCNKHVLG